MAQRIGKTTGNGTFDPLVTHLFHFSETVVRFGGNGTTSKKRALGKPVIRMKGLLN
jgi:hypothetical protein